MTGKGENVKMVPAVCTQCGAALEVDPSQEAAVCGYCGTPFLVQKAINQYSITHASIEHADVHVVKKGTVESVLDFADRQIRRSDEKKQEEERRKREEEERKKEEARLKKEKRFSWFKKNWKIWGGALLVLTILSMFSGGGESARQDSAPSSGQPAQETQVQAQETTYVSREFAGFSYEVPEDWEETKKDTSRIYTHGTDGQIEWGAYEDGGRDPSDRALWDSVISTFTSDEGISLLSSGTVTIDGTDCLRFSMTQAGNNGGEIIRDCVMFGTKGHLIIFLGSRLKGGTDYSAEFDRALSSVRILEPWEKAEVKAEASEETPEQEAASAGGVTPSFKEAMDSYEAFFDEYIEFLKAYSEAEDSVSMMSEYLAYMSRYTEVMEKLDAIDEEALSEADDLYYTQVMLRISEKMLEAAEYQ